MKHKFIGGPWDGREYDVKGAEFFPVCTPTKGPITFTASSQDPLGHFEAPYTEDCYNIWRPFPKAEPVLVHESIKTNGDMWTFLLNKRIPVGGTKASELLEKVREEEQAFRAETALSGNERRYNVQAGVVMGVERCIQELKEAGL